MSFPQRAQYKYTCQALLSQGDIYVITTLQIMQQNTTEEASYAIKKNLPTGYSFYTSRKHSCFQDCLFCSLNRELGHREQATLGDGQWYSVFDKIEMNPIRKPQERIFTPLGRSTGPSAISAFPKPFEELKRMTSSVSNETHT